MVLFAEMVQTGAEGGGDELDKTEVMPGYEK